MALVVDRESLRQSLRWIGIPPPTTASSTILNGAPETIAVALHALVLAKPFRRSLTITLRTQGAYGEVKRVV